MEADEIKRFAAEFDPQPFHLSDEAARATIFQGLAASGWHTAALTMKLLAQSDFRLVGGIVGVGFEGRWPKVVRPGGELHVEADALDVRPSKSNATRGVIVVRVTTLNQGGEAVLLATFTLLVPRGRSSSAAEVQPPLADAGMAKALAEDLQFSKGVSPMSAYREITFGATSCRIYVNKRVEPLAIHCPSIAKAVCNDEAVTENERAFTQVAAEHSVCDRLVRRTIR